MTTDEKIARMKLMCKEKNEKTLLEHLEMAKEEILNRAYPYDDTKTEVPRKYESKQIEIAVYLLSKRGGIGEVSHSENGTSRTWESASVPPSMLASIIPTIGTIGR